MEFKYTLADPHDANVRGKLDAVPEQGRRVYFFDTNGLNLDAARVVVRGRVTDGENESTVKLRPLRASDEGAAWRTLPKVKFEADMVGAERSDSAKIDDDRPTGSVESGDVSALLAGKQEDFLKAVAPGVDLKDLRPLGPVEARKWELPETPEFRFDLDVEEWKLPDGQLFLELSIKVDAADALTAHAAFQTLLRDLKQNPDAPQATKTKVAIDYFNSVRGCKPPRK